MKKILLIIALLISLTSWEQTPVFKIKNIQYFSNMKIQKYINIKTDITITFTNIDSILSVYITDNISKDTLRYILMEDQNLPQYLSEYYLVSFFCINPNKPYTPFLITFMFYRNTKNMYAISISDGTQMVIYQIYYPQNDL